MGQSDGWPVFMMTSPVGFKSRRFGTVALTIAFLEITFIYGLSFIAMRMPQHNWDWLRDPLAYVYVGGILAIPVAVIGLIKDTKRTTALLALVMSLANMFLCSWPFAV
jgi:hypothetical protein